MCVKILFMIRCEFLVEKEIIIGNINLKIIIRQRLEIFELEVIKTLSVYLLTNFVYFRFE